MSESSVKYLYAWKDVQVISLSLGFFIYETGIIVKAYIVC